MEAAKGARENAHAAYSKFLVGAAIRLRDGRVFVGANVEICVFPLGVCAERNAVAAAVVAGAKYGDFERVVVVGHAVELTPPCGACRQVLAEFADASLEIVTYNLSNGEYAEYSLGDLLPNAFTGANLIQP